MLIFVSEKHRPLLLAKGVSCFKRCLNSLRSWKLRYSCETWVGQLACMTWICFFRGDFWSWIDAKLHAKLAFTAWDMSNTSISQYYTTTQLSQFYCLPDYLHASYPEVSNSRNESLKAHLRHSAGCVGATPCPYASRRLIMISIVSHVFWTAWKLWLTFDDRIAILLTTALKFDR